MPEGEQRPVIVEGEPNDVLLAGLRVGLRRVFGEAVGRDETPTFRLQPASPVRRGGVLDVGDWYPASRWRRDPPPHHHHLAAIIDIAHHRSRIVGEHAGHRREVADVAIDDAEQPSDGRLVRGDRRSLHIDLICRASGSSMLDLR